jgi:hypothetical protein
VIAASSGTETAVTVTHQNVALALASTVVNTAIKTVFIVVFVVAVTVSVSAVSDTVSSVSCTHRMLLAVVIEPQ